MDHAALVKRDIEIGKIVSALSLAKIPVTALDWDQEPELDKLQLTVVTRLVDQRAPREAYARILDALSKAGVYDSISILQLRARSPEDPIAKQLMDELKMIAEGSVHIVRNKTRNRIPEYTLVFAPYLGSGGPIPGKHLKGNAELREFLEGPLRIRRYVVDPALVELEQTDSTTIFNVQISRRQAKRLNLAA
jgi:hypothetical protein